MKKYFALVLVVLLVVSSFVGCGDKDEDNTLYYQYDMKEFVKVGDYSNEIDKSSSDYSYAAGNFYDLTFGDNLKGKLTEGKVEDGDIANIDYKGLLDGVAFEGGTAAGYDLTIGSNSFIDGFEDGLIGAEIGKQIDLNLTFPKEYHSADLAGKSVVFEVTVNYVTRMSQPNENNITRYGYESLAAYEKALEEYASAFCLYYNIYRATTIKEYPEKEDDILYDYSIDIYSEYCSQNNVTLEQFATANGMTEDELYDYISENEVHGNMEFYMVAYYIIQDNNAKLTTEDIEAKRAELDEMYDDPLDEIGFNEISIQQSAAFDKALEVLKDDVVIKK